MKQTTVIVSAFGMNHIAIQRENWIVDRRALCGQFWDTTSHEAVHFIVIDCQSCLDLAVAKPDQPS